MNHVSVVGWVLVAIHGPATATTFAAHRSLAAATVYTVPAGRSPLLQVGETMRTPRAARRLRAASDPADAGRPVASVRWDEARQHLDQVVTVEGRVVRTGSATSRRHGRLYFLNFVEPWRDTFYVVIFEETLGAWPRTPDVHFAGATIRVTGRVTLHRQTRPQIAVRRSDQIEIVTPAVRDP